MVNFHELESFSGKIFRWSEPVSMIRIRMPQANVKVTIDTGCLRGDSLNFPFQIHWNDYPIPTKSIHINQGMLSFEVNARVCAPTGEQRLTISSKPLKAENGRRMLGIPFCSLQIQELDHKAESALPFPGPSSQKSLKRSTWINPFSLVGKVGKGVTPSIPIWQVRIPDLSYVVPPASSGTSEGQSLFPACEQVIVAACEINARHGTGLLIQYLVDDFEKFATVNSYHCYNGDRVSSKVHHCLPDYKAMSRQQIYEQVHKWFGNHPPRQAYVVPYFASDFLIASALKDLFKTKICIHVMDDNCLFGDIPPEVVQEAIKKSDLLLMISPEMRNAYEQRFGKKAFMLPPIVPQTFIPEKVLPAPSIAQSPARSKGRSVWNRVTHKVSSWMVKADQSQRDENQSRGILIGNVWDKAWLEMLRNTIRESGLQIDWYANNPNALWLNVSPAELEVDGIHLHDSLWGQDLVDEMRKRPFAIMPTGALTGEGNKESIARLSLPSRVPFIVSTAQLPIIVLGSPETAAARFLSRFELGSTVPYDGAALRSAVAEILDADRQAAIRRRAYELGSQFSSSGAGEWLWQSLNRGEPVDDRFERPFAPLKGELSYYFDAEPPTNVHWSFRDTWKLIHRIKQQDFNPDVIIDVGASTGIWSWTASTIFPDAKFILVDPLMSRYPEHMRRGSLSKIKKYQFEEVALSDHCGKIELLVSDDLYGSSLLKVNEEIRKAATAQVELLTLDELARKCQIHGRTLLKIDVQFAEHLVIGGGLNFISNNVDFIILELTLHRPHDQAKTYREMLEMMDQLGFEVIDEMEGWRDPQSGVLEQKDTVFVRKERHPMLRAA
jgi:FkbM family methyltransferase